MTAHTQQGTLPNTESGRLLRRRSPQAGSSVVVRAKTHFGEKAPSHYPTSLASAEFQACTGESEGQLALEESRGDRTAAIGGCGYMWWL